MKPLFKIVLWMLITSISTYAQKTNIYTKSFDANKNTSMIINMENSTTRLEPSTDGKVHINYDFEFDGYSKKEIKVLIDKIHLEATLYENTITLMANQVPKAKTVYAYNGKGSIFIENDLFGFSKKDNDSVVHKSKDSVIKQIRYTGLRPITYMNSKFKVKENGKIKNLRDKSSVKIVRGQFVIKVPPFVKLTVTAKNSYINFKEDIINELHVDLKKGGLNAVSLLNNHNKLVVDNAIINVEQVLGGNYALKNIKKGVIGKLQNVKIDSEFSKVEIGEIGKGALISDFNSEYWFYNFSNDFKRFDLYSEYSKIHFFYPEFDHSFKVFGHNTVNHIGGMKIEMQPNKKGEKFNMMEKKAKGEGPFSGHINFDIVHGIIYSHNDSILTINRDSIIKTNN